MKKPEEPQPEIPPIPPRWQDADHQRRYLNEPLPDPTKSTCSCGRPKHLVFNKQADRYAECYFCPECDGDL